MSLDQQLAALRAAAAVKMPEEARKVILQARADLEASGIVERVLKPGDSAPEFILKNCEGSSFSLDNLRQKGPVVLTFFRGGW